MNKKAPVFKLFVYLFVVFGGLTFSANSLFAQCGNYFKTNYSTIYKHNSSNVGILLDDWTGDGKSDFWNLQGSGITIYPAKSTGYWDWDNPISYTASTSILGGEYAVKDLDSDGRMDLAFVSGNSGQIFHNAGNGSLIASAQISDTDGPANAVTHVGYIKINNDNLLDWIYVIYINNNPQIRYQLQNADGTFGSKTTILTGSAANGTSFVSNRLGDFNGDGKTDLVYNTEISGSIKSVVLKNLGNGSFETGTPLATDLYVFRAPIKDFNNDGRDDVISRNIIFLARADGTFDRVQLPGGSATQYNMLAAKLNNDSNWDVIELGSGYYAAYINDGAGNFTKTVYSNNFAFTNYPTTSGWRIEDFNNDGKDDFYDARTANPELKYNVFGERLLTITENNCQPSGETKKANFDVNPNPDVVTWNATSGNWSSKNAVWGNSADSSSRTFNWGSGSHGDVPALGDYDGDGLTDYSVYRNSTGVWYVFRSSDSSWMTFQFGLTGDIAVPNDYNGGGKTDIAVFRPSNGGWYIWLSETQQFLGVLFGVSEDKPVPADYDGDKKTDVAVYRPSTGVWYYLKSSDNSFNAIQWGNSTDKPVPADYDGDGKADLTIYRDGVWWMLRSSNGLATAIQYGTANDIPVPVYRNSVSADMTLYNPSNNTWNYFANRYASGITLGGNQDKPVYFGLPNN